MQQFEYKVTYPVGLHARPSGMIAKESRKFSSDATITRTKTGKSANAKETMAIMRLGIITGETVLITVNGDDEENAMDSIKNLFADNL